MKRLLWALALSLVLHAGCLALFWDAGRGATMGSIGALELAASGPGIVLINRSIVAPGKSVAVSVAHHHVPDSAPVTGMQALPDANADAGAFWGAKRYYYRSDRLTLRPVALSEVRVDGQYVLSGWPEDHVRLRLWIEADGRVSLAEVEASAYPAELTSALREAFAKLVFSPGEVEGVPVPVLMEIEARYGGG